jgi:hypothetical protein
VLRRKLSDPLAVPAVTTLAPVEQAFGLSKVPLLDSHEAEQHVPPRFEFPNVKIHRRLDVGRRHVEVFQLELDPPQRKQDLRAQPPASLGETIRVQELGACAPKVASPLVMLVADEVAEVRSAVIRSTGAKPALKRLEPFVIPTDQPEERSRPRQEP